PASQRASKVAVALSRWSEGLSDVPSLSVAFSRPATVLFTGLTDC
ncbi:hypothetical protein A2U01_0111724, partial [Trifolium medium]|nr:hypothetical protein [Trifolium medium]